MRKDKKIINENYDLSGGAKSFDKIAVPQGENVTIQVTYSDVDQADMKLKVEQSLDGLNFDDISDANGDPLEITVDNTNASLTLSAVDLNTSWVRLTISDIGTVSTGTIDSINYLTS